MIEMAQEKVVKYFKSAIGRQLKETKSKTLFIWLMVEQSEPSIYVQIDEGIYDQSVVSIPKFEALLNTWDQVEIAALEQTFKFSLAMELRKTLELIASHKNCDFEKLRVCIYETGSKLVAKTYEGENEISCDYFRQLLALEPKTEPEMTDTENETEQLNETT